MGRSLLLAAFSVRITDNALRKWPRMTQPSVAERLLSARDHRARAPALRGGSSKGKDDYSIESWEEIAPRPAGRAIIREFGIRLTIRALASLEPIPSGDGTERSVTFSRAFGWSHSRFGPMSTSSYTCARDMTDG